MERDLTQTFNALKQEIANVRKQNRELRLEKNATNEQKPYTQTPVGEQMAVTKLQEELRVMDAMKVKMAKELHA